MDVYNMYISENDEFKDALREELDDIITDDNEYILDELIRKHGIYNKWRINNEFQWRVRYKVNDEAILSDFLSNLRPFQTGGHSNSLGNAVNNRLAKLPYECLKLLHPKRSNQTLFIMCCLHLDMYKYDIEVCELIATIMTENTSSNLYHQIISSMNGTLAVNNIGNRNRVLLSIPKINRLMNEHRKSFGTLKTQIYNYMPYMLEGLDYYYNGDYTKINEWVDCNLNFIKALSNNINIWYELFECLFINPEDIGVFLKLGLSDAEFKSLINDYRKLHLDTINQIVATCEYPTLLNPNRINKLGIPFLNIGRDKFIEVLKDIISVVNSYELVCQSSDEPDSED